MEVAKLNRIEKLRDEAGEVRFKPMPGYLVVRLFDPKAFKKTQLHLPEQSENAKLYKEMPLQGIVVAVGDDFINDIGSRRPMVVKRGDHIALLPDGRIMDFRYRDTPYAYCRVSDVLGVYDKVNVPASTAFIK